MGFPLNALQGTGEKLSITMARHIGISIECYGRLLIQKQAMEGEVPMRLNPELKSLMSWATDVIVPTLLKLDRQDNQLIDLDLSSIMSAGSPIFSPASEGRPRKTRPNSSPIAESFGDASFISERKSNIFGDMSTYTSARAVAICATIPILCTVTEWLSIRFVGDSFVSERILKLCELLECTDKTVRKTFLPVLFYVAVVYLKNEGDSVLLQRVLLSLRSMDRSPIEVEIISDSMAFLLSTLRDESTLKAAILAVIQVTRIIVIEAEEDEDESTMDTSFIEKAGVCVRKVLEIILIEKRSSLLLAQCLLDNSNADSVRESLFKELDSHAPKTDALKKILHIWTAETKMNDTATQADNGKENMNVNLSGPIAA